MIRLQKNDSILRIDSHGFIIQYDKLMNVSKSCYAYPVVFKEYSRMNPFCRTLDASSEITVNNWSTDTIEFTKPIKDLEFYFTIELYEDSFKYSMKMNNWSAGYEFGIALPVEPAESWATIHGDKVKPLAVYSPFFHEDFIDQTFLKEPLLQDSQQDSQLCFFGDLDTKITFFQYKDNGVQLLRITTLSASSDKLSVYCQKTSNPSQCILASNKIQVIQDKFKGETGIELVVQKVAAEEIIGDFKFISEVVPLNQLTKFYELFLQEYKKYPSVLSTIAGIKGIYLGSSVKANHWRPDWGDHELLIRGMRWGMTPRNKIKKTHGWLLFDADALSRGTIHHEIFHSLQEFISLENYTGDFSILDSHPSSKKYIYKEEKDEYLAEIFATMMTTPHKAYSLDSQAADYIRGSMDKVIDINWQLDYERNAKSITLQCDNNTKQVAFGSLPEQRGTFYIESPPIYTEATSATTHVVTCECSGLSLLQAILNCSNDINDDNLFINRITIGDYRQSDTLLLDILNTQYKINAKYIWLVRHPLESVCSLHEHYGVSYAEGLAYWEHVNLVIWYFLRNIDPNHTFTIKFEELIMNKSRIKNAFQFIGIPFHDQFLEYGDFNQSYSRGLHRDGVIDNEKVDFYEKSPEILEIWHEHKNKPIMLALTYCYNGEI